MSKADLEARFAQSVSDGELLVPGDRVVVAVSGGPDSVSLLHLLDDYRRRHDSTLQIHVAHLNHQLRGADSEADAAFTEELCRSLRLACTIESTDVRIRSDSENVSMEQAARRARFEFFQKVCLTTGFKTVALAHHADDDAETILHRIVRGTGLRGLAGIRPIRPLAPGSDCRLIRPLLRVRRTHILEYLTERNLAYRLDKTNDDPVYVRNRFRHEVLPLLSEFNPQVVEAVIRLADQARSVDGYLTETSERMLESMIVEHTPQWLELHGPSLARKPRVIRTQLIRQAILRMGVPERDMTHAHLNAVAELAADQEGSRQLHLPGGLRVSRRYSRLILERATETLPPGEVAGIIRVATNGATLLPAFNMEMTVDTIPAEHDAIMEHIHSQHQRGRHSFEEWIDADRVHAPLLARTRQPGDRFFPLGMSGMKKLSDFFIDEKIDAEQRERIIVLCDQLGPIWIAPYRIDERVRLTENTRHVMRLIARPIGVDQG